MYIVPDLLELQFPHVIQGYFSSKRITNEEKIKILCNWICKELIGKKRSWASIKKELQLGEYSFLEDYFTRTVGLTPEQYAKYWIYKKPLKKVP